MISLIQVSSFIYILICVGLSQVMKTKNPVLSCIVVFMVATGYRMVFFCQLPIVLKAGNNLGLTMNIKLFKI